MNKSCSNGIFLKNSAVLNTLVDTKKSVLIVHLAFFGMCVYHE